MTTESSYPSGRVLDGLIDVEKDICRGGKVDQKAVAHVAGYWLFFVFGHERLESCLH